MIYGRMKILECSFSGNGKVQTLGKSVEIWVLEDSIINGDIGVGKSMEILLKEDEAGYG